MINDSIKNLVRLLARGTTPQASDLPVPATVPDPADTPEPSPASEALQAPSDAVIPTLGGAGLRPHHPSLFFVSLPKSGTVYTWNMLERATGLKIPDFHNLAGWGEYTTGQDFACPDLYACGDYNTQLLRPENMHLYMKGMVFGGHMQASFHNLNVLKQSGIDRITVLLRDPRDAFVSWVHHVRSLGPSARAYHSKTYHLSADYYDWPLPEQFAYQIRTFLPITVNWVEGWLDNYADANASGLKILLVYYDELKNDPKRYIKRIVDFHGVQDADLSGIQAPESGKMHFRKGQHGQWREEFSGPDQALAGNLMQDRIARCFQRAASSHEAFVTAQSCLAAAQPIHAAEAAVRGLQEFPSYRPGYDLFGAAAQMGGADIGPLSAMIEQQLSSLEISDYFLSRSDLLKSLENLLLEMKTKLSA